MFYAYLKINLDRQPNTEYVCIIKYEKQSQNKKQHLDIQITNNIKLLIFSGQNKQHYQNKQRE